MTARAARRVAWGAWALSLALGVLGVVLRALAGFAPGDIVFRPIDLVMLLGFSTMGLLLASRQPANTIGWIFVAMGAMWALAGFAQDYAFLAHATGRTSSPLARIADWSGEWGWMPIVFLAPMLLALLFPTGRPLSPRWSITVWVAIGSMTLLVLATAFAPGPLTEPVFLEENPFALAVPQVAIDLAFLIGALGIFTAVGASLVSLVIRYRRSRGDERQQMKWLAFALGITVALSGVGFLIGGIVQVDSTTLPGIMLIAAIMLALAFVPIAAGIAILRYRLYDIDVVIDKTVVYGALATFITVVYVAVVVGIGSLLGRGDEPNIALQVAATALVAVAFQPVRERVQRFANRLVYGKRATPYEVMAGFSHRVAGTLSVSDVLPEMAEVAATGVGAERARVRLLLPTGERAVGWPPDAEGQDRFNLEIPVRYRGEPIGEIAVRKPTGEPLAPTERALLEDLASQAGLALHNVRLAEELRGRAGELAEQAEQLRRSRERLVTARDVQRRRLERDIREGAQRELLAIGTRLREAAVHVEDDPGTVTRTLDELGERANATLEGLRDLARGIFPPLLAEEGVVYALEAHVRKVGANAAIHAEPAFAAARFDAEVEAALYFCCVQAIQNVLRHGANAPTRVRLSGEDGEVAFEVRDEGRGFDPAAVPAGMGLQIMRDRVEALEGSLEIVSAPGAGTTVTGRVPARALEGATP